MTNTSCAACGIVFGLPDAYEASLRKTGKGFWCPNGHSLTYGEGEDAKIRRERDRLKQQTARLEEVIDQTRQEVDAERRRTSAAKGQITKLKNRAAAGVCPCCNRTFAQLARHMAGQHPGFIAEPLVPDMVKH